MGEGEPPRGAARRGAGVRGEQNRNPGGARNGDPVGGGEGGESSRTNRDQDRPEEK